MMSIMSGARASDGAKVAPEFVGLYDYGGSYMLVQEHLQGDDLFGHVSSRMPIAEEEVRCIIKATLRLVESAHGCGVALVDLKMENLVLVETYEERCVLQQCNLAVTHVV